ncbi:MAG: GNAT family N-acetyltransferase [Actinobacteria bacterium]|nr:GNAT family N-acetyltransferase [Actinomycetota bacterium]
MVCRGAGRAPWRRRGLARSLLAQSLGELRARGLTEAALSTNADNAYGSVRFYASMGYASGRRRVHVAKPLER